MRRRRDWSFGSALSLVAVAAMLMAGVAHGSRVAETDEAIALLDRMAELHSGKPAFVRKCCGTAARICRRIKRYDRLPTYIATLKALATSDKEVEPDLRRRCAEDVRWLQDTLKRAPKGAKETGAAPKAPG